MDLPVGAQGMWRGEGQEPCRGMTRCMKAKSGYLTGMSAAAGTFAGILPADGCRSRCGPTMPGAKTINRRRFLRLAGLGGVACAAGYPFLVERRLVFTNTCRVPLPNLPAAFAGLRIAHLTDLHYGGRMPLRRIKRIVERTNELGCDVIVATGDYVNGSESVRKIDEVWSALAKLRAPLGVHAVLGNHDHWADGGRSRQQLAETGQNLHNTTAALVRGKRRIHLVGAGDLWTDPTDLDPLLDALPESDCRIVLAHNPDSADADFRGRVDLFVCGHTHGGQVRIPFVGAPVLPVGNREYSSGLKASPRGTPVFISRGIGWAILPVRLNCPPEIAVLELTPAAR